MLFMLLISISLILAILDLGFAITLLVSSVRTASTFAVSPLVFTVLTGIMLCIYGGTWVVVVVVAKWNKTRTIDEPAPVRFYTVHFFRCFMGYVFTSVWGIALLALNDPLYHFPTFLLTTDDSHLTTADVVGENVYFVNFRMLLWAQMAVSLRNIAWTAQTMNDRRVAAEVMTSNRIGAKGKPLRRMGA
jgi:hypothetical protein